MTEFDTAIIGGGLAGCSAAITLAARGHRVGLFESKPYPHHKVCGEFLSPECAALLDEFGLTPAILALKPALIDTAVITAPDGMIWESALPGVGMGVSRYALDALLAERACSLGVTIYEETAVNGIDGSLTDGFSLESRAPRSTVRVRAKTVIAAHGKRSSVDRLLNRHFLNQRQPFVGLKMHYSGQPIPRRVELHTFDGGYCGLSEIEGGRVNACLLVRESTFQRAGQGSLPRFLDWMRRQNPRLEAWLSSAHEVNERWLSIAQIPFVDKPPVERDLLMAGDSAGLIAPLAGDGMSMALYGGRLAAAHISGFLDDRLTADELRRGYTRAWRSQFGERLHLGRLLQSVILRPRLLAIGLRAANSVPALGQYFVTHTRDTRLAGQRG